VAHETNKVEVSYNSQINSPGIFGALLVSSSIFLQGSKLDKLRHCFMQSGTIFLWTWSVLDKTPSFKSIF